MRSAKVFQIIRLGVFSGDSPKKEFRIRPISYGRILTGAFLFSPDGENNGEKAYATLRLTANNRSELVSSFTFPLQKDDPEDSTPREFFPLEVEIKPGQFLQGYVEVENPTREVEIKLYLIFSPQ